MTTDRWQQIEAIFHAAVARPPAERTAFLDAACAGDAAMRHDVESLLNESQTDDGFLAEPAVVLAAHVIPTNATLMIGRTLASYRLEALLGAGGMGEVYRAHDTRLDRAVAIKILPEVFTTNPDRLARFEREARMLAALNHPNICAIHGVEEASGIKFLILELVDGETLASTIASRSPLQVDDALAIARQIAEALEAAHERGIIHRDLKPANVSVTRDAVVKVLDFGLAKPVESNGAADLSTVPDIESLKGRRAVIGTAAYMSPEQARGSTVDKRTDIWSFGCVLYEMLSGRCAFGGDTVSDSIAKILEREPDWSALPAATPTRIRHLLRQCLNKDPKQRLRDIGDARLEIGEISRQSSRDDTPAPSRLRSPRILMTIAGLFAATVGAVVWLGLRPIPAPDPFANARFSTLTDWDGTETLADISPDGRFVVFLSDRSGQLDIWWTQVGTNTFKNLTEDVAPLDSPGVLRTFGLSGDGAEVWFGSVALPNMVVPQTGGAPRRFLTADAKALAWSGDASQIAYFTLSGVRDPLWIADRAGSDAGPIDITPSNMSEWAGIGNGRAHNHNPVWSPDGEWIYFVHGVVRDWNHSSDEMDIWRIRPKGGAPERVTRLEAAITFVAPLDSRTLLYIGPAADGSGSWLWSYDIGMRTARKVVSGLEQFTSVSVSRDGTRIVATRANPTATLWTVPILDRDGDETDVRPYPVNTKRALSPRFGGASLFYLSSRGAGDGLWRLTDGLSVEVHRAADGILHQAPAPSPDGERVAVVRRRDNKHVMTIMSANGTEARTLAPTLDIHGTPDWSPDGQWIVTGGVDASGRQGLFKMDVANDHAGTPIRIADGDVVNPVWSPDGTLIVYAGPFVRGQAQLFSVRPDGMTADFPPVQVSPGGYRFLPDATGLVYLPRPESLDFWLLDLRSKQSRQLTHLANHGTIRRFDLTRDGKQIVFDRLQQNSDIVLIERPRH